MRTSEILHRAADLIEERGWTSGSLGWYEGNDAAPLCIEGGIMAALGVRFGWAHDENNQPIESWPDDDTPTKGASDIIRECPAYAAVQEYLGLNEDFDLYRWNDGWGGGARTKEQVIETLRTVAVIEAAKEDVADLTGAEK